VSSKNIRAIFIRHGQSTANIGEPTDDFAQIPLTPLGQQQAEALAATWTFTPGLIVVSPFLRTQQTAAPTIARFANVPVETWPVYEFTYWDRAHWGESRPEDEWEKVDRYWSEADPDHREGQQAESFSMLLDRVRDALDRLEKVKVKAHVLVFTHGHFMQALRHSLLYPEWTARQHMQQFREFDQLYKIKNVEQVELAFEFGMWRIVQTA
jgi:broad specificity phosphatase PhoE